MKRALRYLFRTFIALLVAVCLPVVLLYIPPVQRWAVGKAVAYAREATGMDINIKALHLAFPLDIELQGLRVQDGSTVITDVDCAIVDLNLSRLFLLEIGVDAVELRNGSVDTGTLIPSLHLSGGLQLFHLRADEVNLRSRRVSLSGAYLDGCDLDIALIDTTVIDTTESTPADWLIEAHDVSISESQVRLHMPGDSMLISADIGKAQLKGGDIDLAKGHYAVRQFVLEADSLSYSLPYVKPLDEGLDYNHMAFDSISLEVNDLRFEQQPLRLNAKIDHAALKERCGLCLQQLTAKVELDSASIHLSDFEMQTSGSSSSGRVDLEWAALSPNERGQMDVDLSASLGDRDVLLLAGAYLPPVLKKAYPSQPLRLDMKVDGNVDSMTIRKAQLCMPTAFDIHADGALAHVMDSLRRSADLQLDAATADLSFLSPLTGLPGLRIPRLSLQAEAHLRENSQLAADVLLREGKGSVRLLTKMDLRQMAHQSLLNIKEMQVHDFLPHDSIYSVTAHAKVSGVGTDILSPSMKLKAQAAVEHLGYGTWNFDSLTIDALMQHGDATIELNSNNDLLRLQACLEAAFRNRQLQNTAFSLDLSHVDLYGFHVARKPLSASMVMHVDGASDFLQTHRIEAKAEAIELMTADSVYHPLDLAFGANLDPEHISIDAAAGDLLIDIDSEQGLDSLLARYDNFLSVLREQADSLCIRQDTLRTLLPSLNASIKCGQRNPVSNIIRFATGYTVRDVNLSLSSGPADGLKGNGYVRSLNTGALVIDTIDWHITQAQDGVAMDLSVANGQRNKAATFRSLLHTALTSNGATASLVFYDGKGRKGMDLGFDIDLLKDGIRTHFTPLNPIIAYRRFTLNEDNYIQLARSGHIAALVDLLADDGTGLKLYSTPNENALQDISLSVNHFNVGELTQAIPFMPRIDGFLHGDCHYMQADSTLTVSTDLTVDGMTYNEVRMGDIGLNAVYFPNADGSHYIDGIATVDGREVLYLDGSYSDVDVPEGLLDAHATMERLPLALANAVMPKETAAMAGYVSGEMQVEGKASNPIMTGEIRTDSLHILAPSYNIDLQIPDKVIPITRNLLTLDRIEAYAVGKTPLVLDGNVNFLDLSDIALNINMAANNYQLINAPKSRQAITYGKVFIDFNSRLWGRMNDLKMRGRFTVRGNTDVTYVLRDSPITVEDQLADLVTFVDFADTTSTEAVKGTRQNIDMQMQVSIEQAAQVHCLLSDDGTDYINLQGGGDLTLTYDTQNDLKLWGRYTIEQGVMSYSIMAIPLNHFKIDNGSYVEFMGEMLNPRLNIRASERTRSSVTENSVPRNVSFDVGLALSKTLDDMGLEFTLAAPEDLTVQNQLDAMTAEERGRVAVTMLVTGMYVTDDKTSNGKFNYANTLNSYLQSAINQIADRAFQTVDLNFGVSNNMTDAGTTTTDYSFSFAKRFWGNRISVIVGGKVSTGANAVNNGQTIIDNISIEYRLDNSATRYVRLYYDRNYESLLEGQITEMGAGLVLRRKTEKLGELFVFRKKKAKDSPLTTAQQTPQTDPPTDPPTP